MIQFFQEYSYFCSLFVLITIHLFFFVSFPKHRRIMIYCGFFALPQALFSYLLVPDYWNPNRIFGHLIGIEDFMFVFFTGGIVWVEAVWIFQHRITINIKIRLFIKRYLIYFSFGIITGSILLLFEIRGVYVYSLMIIWSLFILVIKKEYWILALSGLVVYPVSYVLSLKIVQIFWPDITSLWTWENLWGLQFWTIPLEEIVWSFLYAFTWPITVAYLVDLKIVPRNIISK